MIGDEIPDFYDRISYGVDRDEGFIRKVIHITADAVARVFRNPGAFRQETEGNYSYTLDKDLASGLLSIEPDEWKRLGVDLSGEEFGTHSTVYDGYAQNRLRSLRETRPDLVFQYGWPGDLPGNAEVIL